jgi:hypothetical protein
MQQPQEAGFLVVTGSGLPAGVWGENRPTALDVTSLCCSVPESSPAAYCMWLNLQLLGTQLTDPSGA